MGRHPNSATGWDEGAEAELRALAADEHVVAIGETGLDFYRDSASREDSDGRVPGADSSGAEVWRSRW